MPGFKSYCGLAVVVILTSWLGLAGLFGLLKPIQNGCIMTYMFPQYIPISAPANVSSAKYGLYLYHEGWRKIDYNEHIKKLSGVPVLFIPGNAGSYKQASCFPPSFLLLSQMSFCFLQLDPFPVSFYYYHSFVS